MKNNYYFNYYVTGYHESTLSFVESFDTLKEARSFARLHKDCYDVHIFKVGSYGSLGKELKII